MPFFSSFTGSKTAGRRSRGVKNNPLSENTGEPKNAQNPSNVWVHLTANQSGVTGSDYTWGSGVDYNSGLGDSSNAWGQESNMRGAGQYRRASHTANGVQTIVDHSLYQVVRANTASNITESTFALGDYYTPSITVTNSVSNCSKTEIVAIYGSTANSTYDPNNLEREGFNDIWIDMKGLAGTNKVGRLSMYRTTAGGGSSPTAWVLHPFAAEGGNVPAGQHESPNLSKVINFGGGENNIGYRPFCIELWYFHIGNGWGSSPSQSDQQIFRLGSGTAFNVMVQRYDVANNGFGAGVDPNLGWPRWYVGGTSQFNATSKHADADQSKRLHAMKWNHIAMVKEKWGRFGDIVLYGNGEEVARAKADTYWPNSSGYGDDNYLFNSAAEDLIIGGESGAPQLFDDIRLTVGEPIYTENFTPPNSKLPKVDNPSGAGVRHFTGGNGSYGNKYTPRVDDLIFHGMAASHTTSFSGSGNKAGNYANNSLYLSSSTERRGGFTSNAQPATRGSLQTNTWGNTGVYYFEADPAADGQSGYGYGYTWDIGSELDDFINNHNGGNSVFDWTIEVGFKAPNPYHWMQSDSYGTSGANVNEGARFDFDSGSDSITFADGIIKAGEANATYQTAVGDRIYHGGNNPNYDKYWERMESFVHRSIIRIQSHGTTHQYHNGASSNTTQKQNFVTLSAHRENPRQQYNSSDVTKTRHLALRGYKKISKTEDNIESHKFQGHAYGVYDGYNCVDQGGMSTGNLNMETTSVPVSVGPLKLDTWHHTAIVYKASTKKLSLFLDGKEVVYDTLTDDWDWADFSILPSGEQVSSNNPGPQIFMSAAIDLLDCKFTPKAKLCNPFSTQRESKTTIQFK